jgi:hypothetical protein
MSDTQIICIQGEYQNNKLGIMKLHNRIKLLGQLGKYISGDDIDWQTTKEKAFHTNKWFTPEFIDLAVNNIVRNYLDNEKLQLLAQQYGIPEIQQNPKQVGLVLAGNIPLVGFHDVLCVFLTGHFARIKLSSKDDVLLKHILKKLFEWDPELNKYLKAEDLLKGCDEYIATGSNNSSRYFEFYFRNYPHIIRRNRTSVAILSESENEEQLSKLADDVHQYFGLGCRNVTKLFVPANYNFELLLKCFSKYNYLTHHHKYKNNYDYRLAVHLLNKHYYLTNGSIILIEDASSFSPISELHFEYYIDIEQVKQSLINNNDVQCIISEPATPFGVAQCPGLNDFADGVDTLQFLNKLSKQITEVRSS